jgi:hypothetical protein
VDLRLGVEIAGEENRKRARFSKGFETFWAPSAH